MTEETEYKIIGMDGREYTFLSKPPEILLTAETLPIRIREAEAVIQAFMTVEAQAKHGHNEKCPTCHCMKMGKEYSEKWWGISFKQPSNNLGDKK